MTYFKFFFRTCKDIFGHLVNLFLDCSTMLEITLLQWFRRAGSISNELSKEFVVHNADGLMQGISKVDIHGA